MAHFLIWRKQRLCLFIFFNAEKMLGTMSSLAWWSRAIGMEVCLGDFGTNIGCLVDIGLAQTVVCQLAAFHAT